MKMIIVSKMRPETKRSNYDQADNKIGGLHP